MKKAQLGNIKTAIIVIALLVVVLIIFIAPLGRLYSDVMGFFGIEEKCKDTGLTLTEYKEKITIAKEQNNKVELDKLSSEAKKCFPEAII